MFKLRSFTKQTLLNWFNFDKDKVENAINKLLLLQK